MHFIHTNVCSIFLERSPCLTTANARLPSAQTNSRRMFTTKYHVVLTRKILISAIFKNIFKVVKNGFLKNVNPGQMTNSDESNYLFISERKKYLTDPYSENTKTYQNIHTI